jgi:hypothetical protein
LATPNIENITVFSDASFCHETKSAGGAFWARGNDCKAATAFSFEGAHQAHDAEVIAACKAILRVAEHPQLGKALERGPLTRLVLVVDCMTVERVLGQGLRVSLSPAAKTAVTQVQALCESLQFLLKVNHVKAHKGARTPRQWVNQWCDTHARSHMRKLRAAKTSQYAISTEQPGERFMHRAADTESYIARDTLVTA